MGSGKCEFDAMERGIKKRTRKIVFERGGG